MDAAHALALEGQRPIAQCRGRRGTSGSLSQEGAERGMNTTTFPIASRRYVCRRETPRCGFGFFLFLRVYLRRSLCPNRHETRSMRSDYKPNPTKNRTRRCEVSAKNAEPAVLGQQQNRRKTKTK